jgi:DNA-binding transcriptional LysR family regulator
MLDARRLATLVAVVEHGSFGAAAEALGYTQSAVSQQIAELERVAGLPLLERRPVRPTDAGRIALAAARAAGEALTAADTELRALREGHAGQVRLGTFGTAAAALAVPAIARFASLSPDVAVTVVQVEPPQAHDALIAGELDLAITFDDDPAGRSVPRQVTRTPLLRDLVLAALPVAHPLAARRHVSLARLARERWVVAPNAGLPSVLHQLADEIDAGARYEGEDFDVVLAFVAAGLGVALVPSLAARTLPEGAVTRPLTGAPLHRTIHSVRLHSRRTPPAVAALEAVLTARDATG